MADLRKRLAGKMYSKLREVEQNIRRYRRRKRRKERENNRWFTPDLQRRLREAFRKDLQDAVGPVGRSSPGATIEGDGSDVECDTIPEGYVGSGGFDVECADIPDGRLGGHDFDVPCEDIDDRSD